EAAQRCGAAGDPAPRGGRRDVRGSRGGGRVLDQVDPATLRADRGTRAADARPVPASPVAGRARRDLTGPAGGGLESSDRPASRAGALDGVARDRSDGGRTGYRAWRAERRAIRQARRPKAAKLACYPRL